MRHKKLIDALTELPRGIKKAIVLAHDSCLCVFSSWLAFCLRFDELVPYSVAVYKVSLFSLAVALPIFVRLGLYRAIFRFTGWFATLTLIRAISLYAFICFVVFLVIGVEGVPRSIGVIQPVFFFVGIGISRLLAKYTLNRLALTTHQLNQRRTALIYGAGSAGRQLASGLRQSIEIKPIGFVDDDRRLWFSTINGLPVYGPCQLNDLIKPGGAVTDILLAMPSASRSRHREIFKALSEMPVHVRTLPGISHLANGRINVDDINDVEIEDVLGRDPISAKDHLLYHNITGKSVLVSGAGGSIGSELCRQILVLQPRCIVLFELSEFALYSIERELSSLNNSTKIIPVLGSVLDANKLSRIFRRFSVQTVFHAAAYKHVPMIEKNPAAGVWNNVFGTLRIVESACECGVETFVLVSTDKAVRPANVMGCSKRLAELIVQAKAKQESSMGVSATKLTMVRFGNVLGSSGSVIPLFREQIRKGGPVTVTHPDVVRYFMTIPEAAQLVIQAGTMGEGGDVMVLDMGDPVRILDLAKQMIHLSGFSHRDIDNPIGDIEIKFTGLRPGEKLYEELLIGDNMLETSHSRIMRASEYALDWLELEPILYDLQAAIKFEDRDKILLQLKKAVPEFSQIQ